MPVTEQLGQLTTSELANLRDAVAVLIMHRGLLEPVLYLKLDTLAGDLLLEQEDRVQIEREARNAAKQIQELGTS
jgi:hypothetical protein